jgi:hypothetical protein
MALPNHNNSKVNGTIPFRHLVRAVYSVTKGDETESIYYDIIKILSTRGQSPNVEFLVQWKNKPKDKNKWVLESNLTKCPDQKNRTKLIEAYKNHLNTRMPTRNTGNLNNSTLLPFIRLVLLFLPLISAGEIFDNFKFCSVSKNSKILNYEHNCQLIIDNPVYKTKNFTILEKRSHMINGEVYSCWAEIIWIRSWRKWFLFFNEERLTPEFY